MKLSGQDKFALNFLEKYGELILDFSGEYFGCAIARTSVDRKRVERLADLGLCRIDRIGESTFAVFVQRPA